MPAHGSEGEDVSKFRTGESAKRADCSAMPVGLLFASFAGKERHTTTMAFNPRSILYIDTETTGLMPWHGDKPFAVPLCDQDGETHFIEWPVNPYTRNPEPRRQDIVLLKALCEDPRLPKVFHNSKFDIRMLNTVGVHITREVPICDVLIAARICNTLEPSFGLKELSWKYARIPKDDEEALRLRVVHYRRQAKKLGYFIHKAVAADYWLPKVFDPDDNILETYAALDVIRTAVMWQMYSEIMHSEPDYAMQYCREMRIFWDVYAMEERGVAVYPDRNEHDLHRNQEAADNFLQQLREMVKDPALNPNAHQQLAKYIFGPPPGFGLEPVKFTKTRQPSTSWKGIRIYQNHPFVGTLVHQKAATKAVNTFFRKYHDLMVPDPLVDEAPVYEYDKETNEFIKIPDIYRPGYCLHPTLNQTGARTLRFSSNTPNLQQVADSRGYGQVQARGPFGPRPGYELDLFDYAQQEGRIFAEVSQIEDFVSAYREGRDINTEIANRCWGGKGNKYALLSAAYSLELGTEQPQNEGITEIWKNLGWGPEKCKLGISSPQALKCADRWLQEFSYDIVKADKSLDTTRNRTRAKIILFCKIFGGGPYAVMDLLYCTIEEARAYWDRFDKEMPGIQEFIVKAANEARRDGYVYTLYGNRLHTDPDYAYRACNYRVQGSASQMMKNAIYKTARYIAQTGLDCHQLLTVHDELMFETLRKHAHPWLLKRIKELMEDQDGRFKTVDVVVEAKRAVERWDRKEPIDFDAPSLPDDVAPTISEIYRRIEQREEEFGPELRARIRRRGRMAVH